MDETTQLVVAVSYFLPPDLSPQAIQISRQLRAIERPTFAVAGDPKNEPAASDEYLVLPPNVLDVARVPNIRSFNPRVARVLGIAFPGRYRAPDTYRNWANSTQVINRVEQLLERNTGSTLVTFGEPMSDHLVGLNVRRDSLAPWIAHLSDPWADSVYRRRGVVAHSRNRSLEQAVVEHCDALVFTCHEAQELVMRKYPFEHQSKCFVIEHLPPPSALDRERLSVETAPAPVIRHIGHLYGKRSPTPLLRGFRRYLESVPEGGSRPVLEFVGSVPVRSLGYLHRHPALRRNVRILAPVSYEESLRLMMASNALVAIDDPNSGGAFLLSKLADYEASGRPIIGLVPSGASARFLKDRGHCVPRPTASATAEALGLTLGASSNHRPMAQESVDATYQHAARLWRSVFEYAREART